jgi:hypothetical protein
MELEQVIEVIGDDLINALEERGYLIVPPGTHLWSPHNDMCLLCGFDIQESSGPCQREV